MSIADSVTKFFSKPTSILGIHLWVLIVICIGLVILLILCCTCIISCTCRKSSKSRRQSRLRFENPNPNYTNLVQHKLPDSSSSSIPPHQSVVPEVQIHVEKEGDRAVLSTSSSSNPEVSHAGWGNLYSLKALEKATNGFSEGNVIGVGTFGSVYRGVLPDNSLITVKKLFNNRGQIEKDFKVEVEALGRIGHKNLVSLIGYCIEGDSRLLVYEYVENGDLHQWLHGEEKKFTPLPWDIRMNIILGTAKALTYLHECLEPKVVHRDVKSYNILLDKHFNPKVTDFGLAKLLHSEMSHVTTRVLGTYGYVAPEYACTGKLSERSDIYSYGVLVMEIVTGRNPVNYYESSDQVNLVEWVKQLIKHRSYDQIADPKLPELPPRKELKRVLLAALRCVDPDPHQRPKMGQVIHMIEADNLEDKKHPHTQEGSNSNR